MQGAAKKSLQGLDTALTCMLSLRLHVIMLIPDIAEH